MTQTLERTQAKKIGVVEGLGDIYQVALPLHEQIAAFYEAGIQSPYLVTPEETARIRLAGVSNDFTRTSMTPIGIKGAPTILTKIPLLMNPIFAKMAINAHRRGEYLTLPGEVYEAVEAIAKSESGLEPEDRTAIALSQDGDYKLTPEKDETRFSLGRQAKEYFERFGHETIPLWNLSVDNKKDAVANYLWFSGPRGGSYLDCRDGSLYYHDWAFGVKRKTAEGGSTQVYEPDLTNVRKANLDAIHTILGGTSALEKALAKPLTDELLKNLRIQ